MPAFIKVYKKEESALLRLPQAGRDFYAGKGKIVRCLPCRMRDFYAGKGAARCLPCRMRNFYIGEGE